MRCLAVVVHEDQVDAFGDLAEQREVGALPVVGGTQRVGAPAPGGRPFPVVSPGHRTSSRRPPGVRRGRWPWRRPPRGQVQALARAGRAWWGRGDAFAARGALREPDDLAAGLGGAAAPAVAAGGEVLEAAAQLLVGAQGPVVVRDGRNEVLPVPPHLDGGVLVGGVLVDGAEQHLGAAADALHDVLQVPEPEVSGQYPADLSHPFRADFHVEVVVAGHCGLHLVAPHREARAPPVRRTGPEHGT